MEKNLAKIVYSQANIFFKFFVEKIKIYFVKTKVYVYTFFQKENTLCFLHHFLKEKEGKKKRMEKIYYLKKHEKLYSYLPFNKVTKLSSQIHKQYSPKLFLLNKKQIGWRNQLKSYMLSRI